MAKENNKIEPKIRAEKYEEKAHFDGSLEQMIKIAANTKILVKKEN